MNKDNYLGFKEFEPKFNSAIHSGFARFSAPELERFSKALANHRGTPLSRQERSCPRCLLKTLKQVAEEFYKYQDSPRGKAVIKELENGQTKENSQEGSSDVRQR